MKKTLIFLFFLILIILSFAYRNFNQILTKKNKKPVSSITKIPEKYNFTLFATKTLKFKQLQVKIYIDDKIVIDEDFAINKQDKDSLLYGSIVPHYTYETILSKGMHKIKVTNEENVPVFEDQFELKDQLWAEIGYEISNASSNPPIGKFGFWYQKTPIRFQ